MYCKKCGAEIQDGQNKKYCPKCGTELRKPENAGDVVEQKQMRKQATPQAVWASPTLEKSPYATLETQSTNRKRNTMPLVIGIIGLLLVAGAVVFWVVAGRDLLAERNADHEAEVADVTENSDKDESEDTESDEEPGEEADDKTDEDISLAATPDADTDIDVEAEVLSIRAAYNEIQADFPNWETQNMPDEVFAFL